MGDDSDHTEEVGPDTDADVGSERRTAPMSEFTSRDVAIGFFIFVVGAVIVFGLPMVI